MNPQKPSGQTERKDPGSQPAKQAPGQGQSGKTGADRPTSDRTPQPQNPADLGYDPQPDNTQARGGFGQSSEKSAR
jgi:hypothetical protein